MDGNLHLHAYVKYVDEISSRSPSFFDITYDNNVYHGKYEPAKSAIASIKYISKDDKQPLELGDMDYQQEIVAKESKKRVLGKRLKTGESLIDLIDEFPEILCEYNKWKSNVENYFLDKARAKTDCTGFIPNNWALLLPITSDKKKHFWFWSSEPNHGKTKFLKSIDSSFRASWYNKSETFQSIHKDSQFVLIDEFTTADIKVTTLNSMCDGTYQYPVKGGHSCMC